MANVEVKIMVYRMHPELGHGELKNARPGTTWKCGEGVKLDLTADIIVEENVEIQDDVRIFTHRHHWRHSRGQRAVIQEVTAHSLTIGRDVFIGTAAMLIGVEEIGEGAIIGAGAVIRSRIIKPFSIWIGNPGNETGTREEIAGPVKIEGGV